MSQQRHDVGALIVETIIAEMVSASHAANMPASFVKNIKLIRESDTKFIIENAWSVDDKPLAIFFEHGTKDHWIQPKDPNGVLAWSSGGPQSGHSRAIYSKRADNAKGNTLFSKGHYVTGLPAYEPMHRGFRKGIIRMKERLNFG